VQTNTTKVNILIIIICHNNNNINNNNNIIIIINNNNKNNKNNNNNNMTAITIRNKTTPAISTTSRSPDLRMVTQSGKGPRRLAEEVGAADARRRHPR
jgi:hypothetical protein